MIKPISVFRILSCLGVFLSEKFFLKSLSDLFEVKEFEVVDDIEDIDMF